MPEVPLRALFLEDNPDDAELLALELIQFGYTLEWLRVDTEEAFVAHLVRAWDIILTDFSLPSFDALRALRHVKRLRLDTPVIVVSGAIGEEQAVAAIHEGAVDYINKEYRGRLGAAVRNALSRRRMQRAQREAQRELTRSEQQYRSLFEQNPDAVFSLDAQGNFTSANASLARLTGYTPDELYAMSYEPILAEEDLARVYHHFTQALNGAPQNYDTRGIHRDGHEFYANVTNLPIVIDGEIVGVYGIAKDITDRKRREREQAAMAAIAEALRTLDSRQEILRAVLHVLQDLFENANAVYARIDSESEELIVEDGVGKGKMWIGNRIPADQSTTRALIRQARPFIKHRGRAYLDNKHANPPVDMAKEPEFSLVGMPVRAQEQVLGVLWVSRRDPFSQHDVDILTAVSSVTGAALQRVHYAEQMHDLLRQTQDQARQMQDIVDTVPEAMLVLDRHRRITLVNRAAREILMLFGPARLGDVLDRIGEHSLEALFAQAQSSGDWCEFALQSGQLFEYAVRTLSLPQASSLRNAREQQGSSVQDETGQGSSGQSSSGQNNMGEAPGHLVILRDITQERRHQDAIQSQERLATVGQLAAGIAHDFNNILAVISLYSGSLLKNPDLPKRAQYLEIISHQTQHAAALIAQILDFSRRSFIELHELDLGPFLRETVTMLRRTMPENIEIRLEIPDERLLVCADSTRMQQVLMNLALNARDAMSEGGELTFGLHTRPVQSHAVVSGEDSAPEADEWVVLSVRDSGEGIDPENLPHIFEPFFTTKEPGRGTGLGLSQVYGIVKQHNGEIDVESVPGEGVTFTLYFPRWVASDAESLPSAHRQQPAPEIPQKVLLVEDNPEAMRAIRDILGDQLGYHVYPAASGHDALRIFDQRRQEIDLILCDMVLPETDGIALYQALIGRSTPPVDQLSRGQGAAQDAAQPAPAAIPKMILMSGYPLKESARLLVEEAALGWIQKPFTPDELQAKIRLMFP